MSARAGDGTGLPDAVMRRIEEVVRRTGLEGAERADVRDELIAHFEDGLASGRTTEELLSAFGDSAVSARLIGVERGALHGSFAARVGTALGAFARDVRIAFRRFRASPGFVFTAVLSLAIGIGANTAIFTLVNAIIVRDLPFADADRLYDIYLNGTDTPWNTLTYPDVVDLREATAGVAEEVVATQFTIVQVEREGTRDVEMLPAEMVNGGYFPGLGVRPAIGRALSHEDDIAPGGHFVVMLGWRYWQNAFGGDPGVVGRALRLAGKAYTIVGVAPREFPGTIRGLAPDVFVPIMMQRELQPTDDDPFTERDNHAVFAKVRLRDGASRATLEAALVTLGNDMRARNDLAPDEAFTVIPTSEIVIFPPMDRFVKAAAWMMSAVVALVLLIACANLASFLLAKAIDRRREMAIQLSLGATRRVLVRQLLIETTTLGAVAGLIGVLASVAALRWLVNADLPLPIPVTLDLSPDRTVLLYSFGISVLAGIAFGLAPALQSARTDLATVMREETAGGGRRGRAGLRGVMVTAQVAVSLVLLLVAGLLLRSFQATQTIDPGFGSKPTAVVTLALRADRWNREQGIAFTNQLLDRFRELPGVTGVAATGRLHLDPLNTWNNNIRIDGVEPPPGRDSWLVDWTPVTPDFFDVMGIRVVGGRVFRPTDDVDGDGVAIVNQAFVDRFWPGEDAVGRTFRYTSGTEVRIVGVVATAKVRSLGEPPRPQYYRPLAQAYTEGYVVVANTTADPEATAVQIARSARELDGDVFAWEPKSLARHLSTQLLARRLAAWIVAAFAAMALILASVGLYGLVGYAVSQRRREVGIRMTLGADRASILRLLLGDGLRLVAIGLVVGLVASFAIARLLGGLLYGIHAVDPLTFIVAPVVLLAVALAAAGVPALSATRTDPGLALHAD